LCPIISAYPPRSSFSRFIWFMLALVERFTFLFRARGYDAVIMQREMISTFPTFERFMSSPRILDVDDAIYLHRNALAAKSIAESCSLVICGNEYLAKKFSKWNSNVVVIPTGVDTDALTPLQRKDNNNLSIGWIGTSGNYKYLNNIKPALVKVLKLNPHVNLQIVSDQYPYFLDILGEQLDYREWKPDIENELLPRLTLGIMPLEDDDWARGKCAFKMLQYMAAGVPVVASPVGVSGDILASKGGGIAASDVDGWIDALDIILSSPMLAEEMGAIGRQIVESEYSLDVVAQRWHQELTKLHAEHDF